MAEFIPTRGILDGVATSQTPQRILESSSGSAFTPTRGVLEGIQNIQPAQKQTQQQQQQVIRQGIQQPEQRIVPAQNVQTSPDAGWLQKATVSIGNFFNLGKATDIVDRSINEGYVGQTKNEILRSSMEQVELMKNLIDNQEDPAKKQRIESRLSRYIQDTNDILGDDVFQAPSTLQKLGAAATIATTAIPAVRGGQLFNVAGKSLLKKGLPFGVEGGLFLGGQEGMETGDIGRTAIAGAAGFGLGLATPAALKGVGYVGGKVLTKPLRVLESPMSAKTETGRAIARFLSPVSNVIKSTGKKGLELFQKLEDIRVSRDLFIGKAESKLDKFNTIWQKMDEIQKDTTWDILEKNSRLNPELVNQSTSKRIRPNYTGKELAAFTEDPIVKKALLRSEPITKELSDIQIATGKHAGRSFKGKTKPEDIVDPTIVETSTNKVNLPQNITGDVTAQEIRTSMKASGYSDDIVNRYVKNIEKQLGSGGEFKSFDRKVIQDKLNQELPTIVDNAVTIVEPKLPRGLSGAKPRYKNTELTFESDIDKALYIVGKSEKLSASDGKYMDWLKEIFPKLSDTKIRAKGISLKNIIAKEVDKSVKVGRVVIPKISEAKSVSVSGKFVKGSEFKSFTPLQKGVAADTSKARIIPKQSGPFAPHVLTEAKEKELMGVHDLSERINKIMKTNKSIKDIPDLELRRAEAKKLAKAEIERRKGPGAGKLREKFYTSAAEARMDGIETNLVVAYEKAIRRDATTAAQLKALGFDNITSNPNATLEEIVEAKWTKLLDGVETELGVFSGKEAENVSKLIKDNVDFFIHGGNFNDLIVTVKKFNALKLGLAPIANMTQSINSLLKADLPYVWAGIRSALGGFKGELGKVLEKGGIKTGQEFTERTGLKRASVLDDWLEKDERSLLDKTLKQYLRFFKWTEQGLNRPVASNIGAQMAFGLQRTINSTVNSKIRDKALVNLENMLGKQVKLNKAGKVALDVPDLLRVGNRFAKETQFGANPLEQPWWANTEAGTLFWQFKTFIYQQTRLLFNSTIGELQAGNPGRAARNFGIIATMYPMTGSVIGSLKNIITGKETNYDLWTVDGYLKSIGQVGGMGMFQDVLEAAFRSPEGLMAFFAGPTAGSLSSIAHNSVKAIQNMSDGEIPLENANEVMRSIMGGAYRVPENLLDEIF